MTAGLTAGTAADILAIGAVTAHAVMPWVLRLRRSSNGLRRYDRVTMLLALCAAAAAAAGTTPLTSASGETAPMAVTLWPHPLAAALPWGPAVALGAVAAGAALPWVAAQCSGRALRRRAARPGTGRPGRMANAAHLVGCAAAEEVLWRLACPVSLVAVGAPPALAAALSLTGFCLLHPPQTGWRSLPYLAVAALLFTAAGSLGGVMAAVFAHTAHNTVLACFTTAPRKTTSAELPVREVPRLPEPTAWD
ncbi:hypothetical protein GCM10027074_11230 [Streptomyces deserti]